MTTIEDQRIRKSIQNLNEWQSQIIHGGNHFGAIADVIQLLLDTIAQRDKEIERITEAMSRVCETLSLSCQSAGMPLNENAATLPVVVTDIATQCDTARAALAKYGRHDLICARMFSGFGGMELKPCTCGFTAALEGTK